MKLSIVGSVKIDSRWRKKLFSYNLESLKPISSIISWRVNIVGKYADFSKNKILDFSKDAIVTNDNNSSYYQVIKKQIKDSESDLILFWQEDHLFICSNKNLFFYILQKFVDSKAEILTISHLTVSWGAKRLLPILRNEYLYKEYQIDKNSQKKVWDKNSSAYLTGIPAIYKKEIALEILEFNKPYLIDTKNPHEFELDPKKGSEFLKNRSFIEMIPEFHVFREVFRFYHDERSTTFKKALEIMKLRDEGSF